MNLQLVTVIIWLSIIPASIFAEAALGRCTVIWCAPAALAALIGWMVGIPVFQQSILFFVTSFVLITLFQLIRAIWRRHASLQRDNK